MLHCHYISLDDQVALCIASVSWRDELLVFGHYIVDFLESTRFTYVL
jgi:hypothetical protein